MVSFDSRIAGTPAEEWEADPRLHDRPRLDLDGTDEIIVLAAHPADETLGAGGRIAAGVSRGIPVTVIVVTDGDAAGLGQVRAVEFARALSVLGCRGISLGYSDGHVREQRDEIRTALARTIGRTGDRTLVVAPWRGDGHRDHRVVGEIAAELAGGRRLLEYPVWMWHWGKPDSVEVPWERFASIEIDSTVKRAALAEYRSQRDGDDPVLRPDFVENFARSEELFVVTAPLGAEYFEAVHERRDDPWGFETRWYEERKRDLTLASLPAQRYGRGLEIGCSIGVLTERLADRVDDLLAVDVPETAVERARARLGDRAAVERRDVLEAFPEGTFDLIVLSEVGYYFGGSGLERVLDCIEAALSPEGVLLACHWRHPVSDYPLTGDAVHSKILHRPLAHLVDHREVDFVLGVFSRDSRSVAQRAGLA